VQRLCRRDPDPVDKNEPQISLYPETLSGSNPAGTYSQDITGKIGISEYLHGGIAACRI